MVTESYKIGHNKNINTPHNNFILIKDLVFLVFIFSFFTAVAVACGSNLYILKNNKPYFKFQVPSLPITPIEIESWTEISNKGITKENIDVLVKNLSEIQYDILSTRYTLHFSNNLMYILTECPIKNEPN